MIHEVVTDVENVVYDSQNVVVFVDKDNKAVSTKTVFKGIAHTSMSFVTSIIATSVSINPAAPPPPTPSSSPPANAPVPVPEDKHKVPVNPPKFETPKSPSPSTPPATKPSSQVQVSPPKQSSSPPGNTGFGSGVTYSPYNADNSCKSNSQVSHDLSMVNGYSVIRLYGTDCDQVAKVVSAVKGKSVRLFLGIFDINSISESVSAMKSGLNGDWSLVEAVSVGNELVNRGAASVGQVTAAIGTARAALQQAGYSGPVVTVDTMMAVKAHPELCQASDFCAINCHAFFDGTTLPADAGPFVAKWAKQISQAAGGKRTVVTESGWPTRGGSNGVAIAGPDQHGMAVKSLQGAFASGDLILYSAFNDLWKQDSGSTFGCEKYWGLLGNAPS